MDSLSEASGVSNGNDGMAASSNASGKQEKVYQFLKDLCIKEKRLDAMLSLNCLRGEVADLGILLWHSFGCVSALIQEVTGIFVPVMDGSLTQEQSYRVCAAISLIQSIAANPDTKVHILRSEILMYLVPLLKSASQASPIEYLRISILGLIAAVFKQAGGESVQFLLSSEVMPVLLGILATGSEMCKGVSAYILHHTIEHEVGLEYVCSHTDRLTCVIITLDNTISQLTKQPSIRILKHIVRCYGRLADNPTARKVLMADLPASLRNDTFSDCLQQDQSTRDSLMELIQKVGFGNLSDKNKNSN